MLLCAQCHSLGLYEHTLKELIALPRDEPREHAALTTRTYIYTNTQYTSVQFSSSVVSDSVTAWTVARQAPLSMGFSRQEYWSGLPCPPCSLAMNRQISENPEWSDLSILNEFFNLIYYSVGQREAKDISGVEIPSREGNGAW